MEENLENIDIMLNSTASVKSNMNSGRYLFTITPDLHAKASLDKLGIDSVGYHYYFKLFTNIKCLNKCIDNIWTLQTCNQRISYR